MSKAYIIFSLFVLTGSPLWGQVFDLTQRSIYSDIKAHNVGDVVMVLIAEMANASQESKVNSSARSDVSAGGSVTGNVTDFLPLFGAKSAISNSHDGSKGTQQKEKLTGKISATITERMDSGMLRIQGERIIEVNGETNIMKLDGLVRSRDIRADNTIYSYNIADAKIIYKKNGMVNKFTKPGAFQRWSVRLLSVGLLVMAVLEVSSS